MFDMFKQDGNEGQGSASETVQSGTTSSPNIVVISVGGSVFFGEKPLTAAIAKFGQLINSLSKEGYKFVLVVGGGELARKYTASAKALGANNFVQDEIGIAVTRVNAKILVEAIETAHPTVLADVNRASELIDSGKIPVFGGLIPGITTDTVAALIAESLNATFVNITNVKGIYSADPKKNRSAKLFPELSYDKLVSLMKLAESKPGQHIVLDLPCCFILKRSKIKGIVLKGNDLENIEAAIRGGEFKGTLIEEPKEEQPIPTQTPEPEEEQMEEPDKDFNEENIDDMDL